MSRPGLLADENISAPLVGALRDAGWDVRYVAEHSPGITDREVLALVRDERRVLLTEDKDFGELVFRLAHDVPGLILLRLPAGPWERRWPRLENALKSRADTLTGRYTVIESDRIRSRPMPIAYG